MQQYKSKQTNVGSPWGMTIKILRISHATSMQTHRRDKKTLKGVMKNFNIDTKMENKAQTKAPMINRLYHANYDTYK